MTMVKSWGGYDILIHKLAVVPFTIVGVKWAIMHFIQDDCPIRLQFIQALNELGNDSQNRLCTFFSSQEVAFLEFEIVTTVFRKKKELGLTIYPPFVRYICKTCSSSLFNILHILSTVYFSIVCENQSKKQQELKTHIPPFSYTFVISTVIVAFHVGLGHNL